MPRLPADVLERIPELRTLCSDGAVAKAAATGDPIRVYRALAWARLMGRLEAHGRAADDLLRDRRRFARPVPEGLVTRPEVPMAMASWLLAWCLAGVVAVALAGAAGWFVYSRIHRTVHVVNGFGRPLDVTLGTTSVTVPPGERVTVGLWAGRVHARAAAGPEAVDESDLAVPMGTDLVVYNVAGAAPVFLEERIYQKQLDRVDRRAEPPRLFCGVRLIAIDTVADAFRAPPAKIGLGRSMSYHSRRHVDVFAEEGADGVDLCAASLERQGRHAEATALLELGMRVAAAVGRSAGPSKRMELAPGE